MPKYIAIVLLVGAAFALYSLLSGAWYLEAPLPGGLPAGNALAAIGMCFAAWAAIILGPRGAAFRIVSRSALFASVVWLPVSIALAGNPSLNFSDGHGVAWLVFSAITAALVLCSLVWASIRSLISALKRRRAA